ncbi:YraN family protein [Chitinophaga nivalis]|uniref:YraN family protein n=1 Tax=Chitinophaga nivalis TaxID=2991709 RepID=A0ABT3IKV4_9BACT|nr:YraN family protein [Chitinophaga nivalis]MCW3465715.1 YraN family protein [Chitinophaga nivalis]MCW3484594.1 YraN family protein [Chitinophaga nivalis]
MSDHLILGERGEAVAQAYVRQYCQILHTNWKYERKELDIIACREGRLYFIEVKTRRGARYGWPEMAVDFRKQENIQTAAAAYLEYFALHPATIRFDIIAITFYQAEYQLMHFRDVF